MTTYQFYKSGVLSFAPTGYVIYDVVLGQEVPNTEYTVVDYQFDAGTMTFQITIDINYQPTKAGQFKIIVENKEEAVQDEVFLDFMTVNFELVNYDSEITTPGKLQKFLTTFNEDMVTYLNLANQLESLAIKGTTIANKLNSESQSKINSADLIGKVVSSIENKKVEKMSKEYETFNKKIDTMKERLLELDSIKSKYSFDNRMNVIDSKISYELSGAEIEEAKRLNSYLEKYNSFGKTVESKDVVKENQALVDKLNLELNLGITLGSGGLTGLTKK